MTDYLDDELDAVLQRRVDRHVRFCPRCRRVLGNLRATINRLAGLTTHLETPTDDALDGELLERLHSCWRDPEGDAPASAP